MVTRHFSVLHLSKVMARKTKRLEQKGSTQVSLVIEGFWGGWGVWGVYEGLFTTLDGLKPWQHLSKTIFLGHWTVLTTNQYIDIFVQYWDVSLLLLISLFARGTS